MMKRKTISQLFYISLVLALAVVVLAGCGGSAATPASVSEESGDAYTSQALDTSYPGALDATSQLVLGTLQLEETEHAVTPEQAKALLPLWQALQGGVTAQAEVEAVLKQIEKTMAQEQLAAIAAMQLTQDDMRAWAETQGQALRAGFGNLSEEERAAMRATAEARGGFGGPGAGGEQMPPEMATRRAQFANLSEEERAAMRATAEAGGFGGPGGGFGRPGAGGEQTTGPGSPGRRFLPLNPLIELLKQRAAEA